MKIRGVFYVLCYEEILGGNYLFENWKWILINIDIFRYI